MIIVCTSCSSRIQIEDAKVPAGSFTVRCPKCNNSISSNGQKGALAVGGSPATDSAKFEALKPAPMFETAADSQADDSGQMAAMELTRALGELLGRSKGDGERTWTRRRALVCAADGRRETLARKLDENGYVVFVAADTRQAVERMRGHQLEVVILDPEFDAIEQGAAFVTREVNILRPNQRRRLFFGLISPSLRTLDAHAAFLNNANLTVNVNDIEELPTVLDRAIRDYNELYTDFFRALNISAL
jgi:predicted Zn finger-like uncharacterized protein